MITPAAAIADPNLLGTAFIGRSWDRWTAILKGAYAEPLDGAELALFREVAERDPPTCQVRELWIVAGRRGGKDSIAAAVATVAAIGDYQEHLRPGERATVMCLAVDRSQAQIVRRYIGAYFATVPLLQPLVTRDTDDGLELSNGVEIVVATNSFRAVRGRTIVCAIFDEVAFWRDEYSTSPDVETYTAIVPGMATLPGAMLIGISTPYKRSGLLFDKWRAHYGKNDADVLVIHAPSTLLNPTLPQAVIDAAMARDPDAAAAEWMAEFRSDVADFVSREIVESCVAAGVHELPPAGDVSYSAFVDPSGGSSDSMTLAIGHVDRDGVAVLDAVREIRPPFSPEAVVTEFASLLKSYRISTVRGDRYAGEWPRERFLVHGIAYEPSELSKNEIYIGFLPLLNSGRCRLLENPRLVLQLCSLERRTARGGRDSVDHSPGAHDDLGNAVAGVLVGLGGGAASGWLQYFRKHTPAKQAAEQPVEPQSGDTAQRVALPDAVPSDDTVRLQAPVAWASFFVSAPDGHGRKFTADAAGIMTTPAAFQKSLVAAGCLVVSAPAVETVPAATPGCGLTALDGQASTTTTPSRREAAGGQRQGAVPLPTS